MSFSQVLLKSMAQQVPAVSMAFTPVKVSSPSSALLTHVHGFLIMERRLHCFSLLLSCQLSVHVKHQSVATLFS